jgi:serine/threonine protein kinase
MSATRSEPNVFLHDPWTNHYYKLADKLGEGTHGVVNRLQMASKAPGPGSIIHVLPQGISPEIMQASVVKQPHNWTYSGPKGCVYDLLMAEGELSPSDRRRELLSAFQQELEVLQRYHGDTKNIFLVDGSPSSDSSTNHTTGLVDIQYDYAIRMLMPLAAGLSFYDWVNLPNYSFSFLIYVFGNMLNEIQRFHEVVGYFHLDLSDSNFHVTAEGKITLIDFDSAVKNKRMAAAGSAQAFEPMYVSSIFEKKKGAAADYPYLRRGRVRKLSKKPSSVSEVEVNEGDDIFAVIVHMAFALNQHHGSQNFSPIEKQITYWLFMKLQKVAIELNARREIPKGAAVEVRHLLSVGTLLLDLWGKWNECEKANSIYSVLFIYQTLYIGVNGHDGNVLQDSMNAIAPLRVIIDSHIEFYGEDVTREVFAELNVFPELDENSSVIGLDKLYTVFEGMQKRLIAFAAMEGEEDDIPASGVVACGSSLLFKRVSSSGQFCHASGSASSLSTTQDLSLSGGSSLGASAASQP